MDKKYSNENEKITEIAQTSKDLNKAKEVYFDLLKLQKMACLKHSGKKRVVREGRRPPETGREPRVAIKCSGAEAKKK